VARRDRRTIVRVEDWPPASGEARRLASLHRLAIVDTPRERELDDVADLAVRLYAASYAAVTFVDADTVWAKAVAGGGHRWTAPRTGAPSAMAIASEDGFVSARVGPLPSPGPGPRPGPGTGPEVGGGPPPVQQVAAAALVAPDGERVGAIELGWDECRELDDRTVRGIRRMAEHVGRLLELRAESDEYRRFIELHPDAVTVLDVDGRIELANPALAHLVGARAPEELVGRDFLDLVAPGDRARVASELARVLFARRRSSRLDLGLRCADGRVVACSVSAGHLQASRRTLQLVIRDLEERIRAEHERARLSEQLAQAQRLDLVGRLASGLAHDLNNLVTVMTSNLDLAESAARDLEVFGEDEVTQLLEDLDQVRRAVGRAGQLTTKLLQFARHEEVGEEEVRVADAVDAVHKLAEVSLAAGIRLVVDVAPGLPAIRADRVHLEQALVNLVMNAADAMPEGGTIRLTARRHDLDGADEVGPPLDDSRQYLRLEVADDGVGMDDETLTRAFEPLFTTKPAGKGTGLGLATVLAFVQQVDGVVDLRSTPGEGTTVWMVLPAASPDAGPPLVDRAQPVAGARIVIVDPNERARGVLSRILQGAGYRVSGVGAGEDALELLRAGSADALVTEAVLPGMPGWRTVERARAEVPDLPALILTSTQAPAQLDDVRTLVKPFGGDRLLRTISDLLAGA
jgi:two-component system, cell cycle sensor histidine kinase and response regulator CckA